MKTFQYQVLRYSHDQVTGEFVNVGIVVFQPDLKFLKTKFTTHYSRISSFFTQDINGHYLIKTFKELAERFDKEEARLSELFTTNPSLDEISSMILPKDDSSLQFSKVYNALDLDGGKLLNDLYTRYIDKYHHENDKDFKDDQYVWRSIYKQHFDKLGLTEKLSFHSINTENDSIQFDKAWKNGSWNVYQALSFDLKRTDSVKNKVYKWSGILTEIEKCNQPININFLTAGCSRHLELNQFISNLLIKRNKNLSVKIVNESNAEEFANKVKEEIEQHESLT